MEMEIEAKFLQFDYDEIAKKLKELGGTLEKKRTKFTRQVLDLPGLSSHGSGRKAWVRVRDEGDKITATFKEVLDNTVHGVKEVEIIVDDFDKTVMMLEQIGCTRDVFEENYRERWVIEDVELTFDEWPHIPMFIEVEGHSEAAVRTVAEKLGLNWNDAVFGSVSNVYKEYFDIQSISEITSVGTLAFNLPLSDEIEAKRK